MKRNQWLVIGCLIGLLFGFFLVQLVHSQEPADPVNLTCDETSRNLQHQASILPDAQYLFTEKFGWFDRTHFHTGRPDQLLQDVQSAIENGGGLITIQQGVHDGVLGYSAVYRLSSNLNPNNTRTAALGIYLDWSIRFEEWQAQLPHLLVAPRTAFAVEDLPSQYLGFFAQANGIPIAELFACYLGPVSTSAEDPPDFISSDKTAADDGVAGITRLQNKTFMPMVETEAGWQHVDWPEPLQMEPIAPSDDTWQFISETTWYLGDTTPDLLEVNARLLSAHHHLQHLNWKFP